MYVGLNDRDAAWHDLYEVKHLDRRAEDPAEEHRQDRRLGDGPRRQAAAGDAHRRQRRHRGPPSDRLRLRRGLLAAGCSRRATRCSSISTTRAFTWRPTAATPTSRASSSSIPDTKQEEVVESDPQKRSGLRRRDLLGEDRRARRHQIYVGDRTRTYFRDKAFEADYNQVKAKLPNLDVIIAGWHGG